MKKHAYGFTIVELLVVVVVIGILAAITIVTFNGIQVRAHNTARYNELKTWQKTFELYKATYNTYPALADGGYCLGTGFPIGPDGVPRCRDYASTGTTSYLESNNTTLMNELRKVSSIPGGPRVPIPYTIGPYVDYTSTDISLRMIVNGADASACASNTIFDWSDGVKAICRITLPR